MKAEKFSNLPCPYWCSASAGLSDTRTEKNVTNAAIRSKPECAASDKIPSEAVARPTKTFSPVMTNAARTEFPATARFSRRIDLELNAARISGIKVIIAQFGYVPQVRARFLGATLGHITASALAALQRDMLR